MPEPPPVSAPGAWVGHAGTAALDVDWWTAFGDPVLTRYVKLARANNTDLRIAAARVQEARAIARGQHGAEAPTVDFGAATSRADAISVVSGTPYLSTVWQEQFQASYEVDLWGKVRDLSDAADAALESAEATHDAAVLSVSSATAGAYIGLRSLDERLDLARRTLSSREAALAFIRARQQRGYASKLELAQAESEYRATAQTLPQLELACRRSELALRVLLGAEPGHVERGLELSELNIPPMPAAGVPSDLLRRRPDIAASEAQIASNDAQLAAARAQLLPSLKLSTAFGTAGASVIAGDPFTIWSVGGSILAPLFNGGRLRAQVSASASRRDQALFVYEKTVLSAFSEVEDQLAAIELTRQQAEQLEAQRVALQEAVRIAHNRYRAGYATYLEELDAQRSLFVVEQSAVQLRTDRLTASLNLYRALGGGWFR